MKQKEGDLMGKSPSNSAKFAAKEKEMSLFERFQQFFSNKVYNYCRWYFFVLLLLFFLFGNPCYQFSYCDYLIGNHYHGAPTERR